MAKRKSGGLKLKQQGMVRPKKAKKPAKKHTSKAPWSDPLLELQRGGGRH